MSSIAINTQTPPIRFTITYRDILEKYGYLDLPIDLSMLSNEDYHVSVGGVAKMMLALINTRNFSRVRWVSLGPGYPPSVRMQDIDVHFVDLEPKSLANYTKFKEAIYNESHGLGRYEIVGEEYIAYANYNWLSAQKLLEFYKDTDIYFINDFQQLLVGGIIGPSAPAVLWYHIPFVPENLSKRMREFLIKSFEGFDLVIVSTKRDLEGLVRAGVKVKVKQIYPFIDPSAYLKVSENKVKEVQDKYGIKDDDKVVLVVARMDPMKSQDIAIEAIKDVNAKLVLAGDGSFTSKTLGHDKGSIWVNKLRNLAKDLRVEDKVIFTGYVPDEDLFALYQRADVVLLPSRIEGFGLAVCEGWIYGKPAVVSNGAGVSELIIEGGNGYVFKSGNISELAEKLKLALKDEKVGSLGAETVKKCSVVNAVNDLKEAFEIASEEYKKA
ncbi:glycosyl transferase [Sulfolobus sp. A20]|uniref:glycosyltransferase family 4 protein n=1 Tax=Saccharolobus sp. A20 TaxID=1891280 RepID=UPI000845CABF|nr:glycosyltransferase family 4 protein [Sulfolobus sp. A20]TRM76325.1 glycosyltransferase family 1 protein [Sulfolobus sp. A20-N-F8]TRM77545.1 glycosyltransferase family 1 protein [Sulfolobus sp. B5]TRM84295.1 glycosyltransferase family 1 protein [Sulfolobus sp. A20-N-F6]TRM89622.1 glycosyltransferase family 1 protein [Sulfolobus sp. C3]TRM98630.1 glycosyltransferase family 1 protein [Sulfolobus sp. F1]TRN04708.1 glycosyltransferase family 1 protein [Sulfolobus sp. E1]